MLTSSDAKWRCLWHMMVWSIMLTLVSQFLGFTNHIVFYIFAALSVLILPVLTAVYSNTSGRHGAGLLRAGYVFCDPVLACITVTPVLILNNLPWVISHHGCLMLHDSLNETCRCVENRSEGHTRLPLCLSPNASPRDVEQTVLDIRNEFLIIQLSIVAPIILSLLMFRRTRKMSVQTALLTFAYWFLAAIETADFIEMARLADINRHVVFTTEAIVSITMIVINSYAVVTLCSYISPGADRNKKQYKQRFDFLYKVFVAAAGIFLTEIPLLIARIRILTDEVSRRLPGTFFLWLVKDALFIGMIIALMWVSKLGKKYVKIPCKINLDNTNVFFQPEKRDAYIVRNKQVRFQDPPATMFDERRVSVTSSKTSLTGSNPTSARSDTPVSILQNAASRNKSDVKKKAAFPVSTGASRGPVTYDSRGASVNDDEDCSLLMESAPKRLAVPDDAWLEGETLPLPVLKKVSHNSRPDDALNLSISQCVKCGKRLTPKRPLDGSSLGSQNSDLDYGRSEVDCCGQDADLACSSDSGGSAPRLFSLSIDSGMSTGSEGNGSPPCRGARPKQFTFSRNSLDHPFSLVEATDPKSPPILPAASLDSEQKSLLL